MLSLYQIRQVYTTKIENGKLEMFFTYQKVQLKGIIGSMIKYLRKLFGFQKNVQKNGPTSRWHYSDFFAPWVKCTKNGKLYNDESDPRYQKFMKAKIEYWSQWKVNKQGGLDFNNKGLKDPNWRDYTDFEPISVSRDKKLKDLGI